MKHANRNGQAIVEFAMVLVLLLILLMGMAELSLVLYDQAVITNAAREGARAGVASPNIWMSEADIRTNIVAPAVENYCQGNMMGFPVAAPAVTVNKIPRGGDLVTLMVTVTYDYDWLVLPSFVTLANPLKLSATAQMRFEY